MKEKILVIDDEEGIRFTFKEFLSEEGYEVFCSENYLTAMEIIAETDLDLIFADIILGEHTGIEILKDVKERGMLCPVIMITGQPDVDTAADSVRLGAFDYMPKPIHQEALLRITKIALKHKAIITDKERYRNNLDAIFRSVTDAIITVDNETRVIESNAAVEDVFGIAPGDITGKLFHKIINQGLGAYRKALNETLNKQKAVREYRIECRHPKQPRQILEMNSSPLIDRNNQSIGAVLVVRDVTRMTDMESELKERYGFYNIIGKNKKMQDIYRLVENLADIQTTVLITGESGTGKELIARALHYSGPRSSKPLVTVDCSALVENLLESELFGHVKGAFTGAIRDKVGRFQEADNGSIFLDEIGNMSPIIQLKLLRVLQEKEFQRVGDSHSIKVNVRVIAATNRRLSEEVRLNKFREDLYYRFKVVEIELPPLRERLEDIPLLVRHFCDCYNKNFQKEIEGVSDEVLETFMRYPWPGNVRELEHVVERAFVFCHGKTITMEHIPPEIMDLRSKTTISKKEKTAELEEIIQTLTKTDWNKAKAARLLGISRKTLYKKIRRHNIDSQVPKVQRSSNS